MLRPLCLVLLTVLNCAAPGAFAAEPVSHPNVVLIVADDLRPDALGFSGNRAIPTPHLDALARRGARFTRATCSYPICNVSRSEIFSGRLMLDTARAMGGALKFDPQWTLWPRHMKDSGWHTIYSGKWHVAGTPASAGFAETAGLFSGGGAPAGTKATHPRTPTGRDVTGYSGWTFKDDKNAPQPDLGVGLTPDTDRIIAERAIDALQRAGARPFFIQINFTAPHDPLHWPRGREYEIDARDLVLPANFRGAPAFDTGNVSGRDERIVPAPRTVDEVKRERAIYFSQVANVDRQVGRIVETLTRSGQIGRTIVVLTSDHGLALGSHGLMGKQNQYEHTINVPLVMAGPGVPEARTFAAQCYLRDLYPTICELTHTSVPASVQGRSLGPVLRGERAEIHDAIFGYFTDAQRMVRQPDGWKLIAYPQLGRHELFNVKEDPDELRDLAAAPAQQERLQEMKARLAAWQRQHGDPLVAPRS
jgi:arylsulfatase A-like enzyme